MKILLGTISQAQAPKRKEMLRKLCMSPRKCCNRERRHYVTFGGRNGCAHVNSVGFWRVIALLSQTNSIAAARPPHDQIHVSLWFRASSFSCWGPRHGRRSTRSAGAGSSKRPCNARAMVRWPTLQRWQCNTSRRDTRSINTLHRVLPL